MDIYVHPSLWGNPQIEKAVEKAKDVTLRLLPVEYTNDDTVIWSPNAWQMNDELVSMASVALKAGRTRAALLKPKPKKGKKS
ncbi:MAG: hypothetical protein CV089_02295 [Nitrospira sp. WS110]|nr:hypothetical protein [Nitrospira sp. WS110]